MIGRGKADNLQGRAGTLGNAHGQHPAPDGYLATTVLDISLLRGLRSAHNPGEKFRERVPEIDQ